MRAIGLDLVRLLLLGALVVFGVILGAWPSIVGGAVVGLVVVLVNVTVVKSVEEEDGDPQAGL